MDAKKIVLLVVALIIAGGTAFMAKTMFSQASAPQVAASVMPAKDGPQILVATRSLPVGTIIEADSFRYQPWPSELIENAYYLKGEADPASLQGTVVRAAVTAGQPLTKGALVKSGDRGFLAAALGPGMRAVTVPVSAQSGVAGFVFPGDRVDLVLTQTVSGDGNGPALKTSETFIRNVRVLAVDQSTLPEDDEGNKLVKVVATVTLEATPRIAEKATRVYGHGSSDGFGGRIHFRARSIGWRRSIRWLRGSRTSQRDRCTQGKEKSSHGAQRCTNFRQQPNFKCLNRAFRSILRSCRWLYSRARFVKRHYSSFWR